jgi:hypothetical protein
MEDRLNPIAPEGADESTLGGYAAIHGRAPAFEGSDGEAYTPAIEMEAAEDEEKPWAAYLVFLRWARSGSAIMGHLETDDLTHGHSADEARDALEAFPLTLVKQILEETIERKRREAEE